MKLYTTRQMMDALGIRSRQTIYLWGVKPDVKEPGKTGRMMWSETTIRRIAAEHGREVTL